METNIGIVGYRMGNVGSVRNALTAIRVPNFVAAGPEELEQASHIILPGVGAFPKAMDNLNELGFIPTIRRLVLDEGRPMLGICLGMQLLATTGEEHREAAGLDLIPGRVKRLQASGLVIPHVGWNDTNAARETILQPEKTTCYYYVHSYKFVPDSPEHGVLMCDYGENFVAGVARDNVYGVQFHPEKSHADGLALLRRFAEVKPC